MSKKIILFVIVIAGLYACYRVPVTGRKQLNMLPESELSAMALTSYKQFLQKSKVVSGTTDALRISAVGKKIAAAAQRYLKLHNQSNRVHGYTWEFNLVQSKDINAWCMPGGKVVVYSGILPITKDEAGLAVVMSHEIAHAIARHGNERMSQALLAEAGGIALSLYLQQKPSQANVLFEQAYGLGISVGALLPFSRLQETEADKMGLVFMAMAGYDPTEAVGFWQRMQKASSGNVPAFLSTHPSDEKRIENIKEFLPAAKKYFKPIK